MAGPWFVIGISGVTCGGKSSLSSKLRAVFKSSVVINQDDYFLDPKHEKHCIVEELNHVNWEILTSLDMEKMDSDVKTILSSQPKEKFGILIIEGFLILNYKPLADLLDCKFYLTLSKEECRKRRYARYYEPPDPEGYFDLCVWPWYEKHYEEVAASEQDIDGNQPQEELFESVRQQILEKLKYVET